MTDHAPLRTILRFPHPQAHLMEVELRIEVPDPGAPLELWMPVWTPGSYLVREYARHLEGFEAEGPGGAPLEWGKTAKNVWRVEPAGAGNLTVRYRLYGREMSVRTNWIEDGFALVIPAGTFLTARGLEGRPHAVRVEPPPGWAGVWTALDPESGAETGAYAYRARDLDELVDSPLLAGSPAVHDFEVDGKPMSLVNLGEGGLWDGDRAAADVRRVVEGYRALYGGLPFPRYLFLNLITESRGGLEHKNSSVLMTSRYAFRDRRSYVSWLGLVSHEFFHVWNVKRSRPLALGPFDYEREVYTRSLWVAEGVTNYYTDLIPRRAGLTTDEEYLEKLGKLVESVQTTPGRLLTSLEGSSFDAWIKLYRPDENTANTTISYYVKGAVAAWLLDAALRRTTGGAGSLDDLMRLLFQRHAGERGYTDEEVQAAAESVAGQSLGDFFDRVVRGTGELDYAPALAWFGLRFKPEDSGEEAPDRPWLGIETRDDAGRLLVKSVRRDGPAHAAGLNVDDEILALGNYRILPANFSDRLGQYRPGDRLAITVARRDALRTVPVALGRHPGSPWKLEFDPEAPPEAAAARRAWLEEAVPRR